MVENQKFAYTLDDAKLEYVTFNNGGKTKGGSVVRLNVGALMPCSFRAAMNAAPFVSAENIASKAAPILTSSLRVDQKTCQ